VAVADGAATVLKKGVKMKNDTIYIKMCERADEIQDLWKPEFGDFVYYSQGDFDIGIVLDIDNSGREPKLGIAAFRIVFNEKQTEVDWVYKSRLIWLPTQYQLEKIRLEYPSGGYAPQDLEDLHLEFHSWCYKPVCPGKWQPIKYFTSMLQLKFAYVMYKLFDKVWNKAEVKWQSS